MFRRNLVKLCLTAIVLAATALPANAAFISVNRVDGINGSYSAVDTGGVLTVTFDPASFVTKINAALVSPFISSVFAPVTLTTTPTTDDIPGLSLHFSPPLNVNQYGVTSLTPPTAPNVVFDYTITFGQASANGLTMTGIVALDPASATSITIGPDTYDFSAFSTFTFFTLSIGTQDASGTLLYDTLKSGSGSFAGTGQFDQFVTVIPEPASVVLLGIGGIVTVVARRRRS